MSRLFVGLFRFSGRYSREQEFHREKNASKISYIYLLASERCIALGSNDNSFEVRNRKIADTGHVMSLFCRLIGSMSVLTVNKLSYLIEAGCSPRISFLLIHRHISPGNFNFSRMHVVLGERRMKQKM